MFAKRRLFAFSTSEALSGASGLSCDLALRAILHTSIKGVSASRIALSVSALRYCFPAAFACPSLVKRPSLVYPSRTCLRSVSDPLIPVISVFISRYFFTRNAFTRSFLSPSVKVDIDFMDLPVKSKRMFAISAKAIMNSGSAFLSSAFRSSSLLNTGFPSKPL